MPAIDRPDAPLLMACTVGGSPRPVALSLARRRPDRVLFFASAESERGITARAEPPADPTAPGARDERGILQLCEAFGFPVPRDAWQVRIIPPQDLPGCVEAMRAALLEAWHAGGPPPRLLLEITGGTKLMTAALALAGQRLPCQYSYVAARPPGRDGRPTRTKGGLGVTLDGQECILYHPNPWDALGFQTVEDAALLFDGGQYEGAWRLLDRHIRRATDPVLRGRLAAWAHLCEGYAHWDQFRHRAARKALLAFVKRAASVLPDLGEPRQQLLVSQVQAHLDQLESLAVQESGPPLVADLLGTAFRRARTGRLDEAALCAYRAIEAAGQARLRAEHGLDARAVPLERVPAALREAWGEAGRPNRRLKLGCARAFALLDALGDPIGARFRQLGLDRDSRSALTARNESILGHGFRPLGPKGWKDLCFAALHLTGLREAELTVFPRLGLGAAGADGGADGQPYDIEQGTIA